jgi:hypothetical protein
MGTRTIRIPRSKIEARLSELPGQTAQVVMLDGVTHAGVVKSATADGLVILDANAQWTNVARHSQNLALKDIYFIILDVNSPW